MKKRETIIHRVLLNSSFLYKISEMLLTFWLVYDIINGKILRIVIDIIEVLVIFYLNYLKYGFILYTKVVNASWYIKIICNLTNIFLIILTILIGFRHLKYLEENKDGKLEKEIKEFNKK